MREIASVAIQSIAQEKVRHITNAAAGAVGVGATTASVIPDYLGIACGTAALLVSCAIFYKTYQEIKLNNIKLAKEDRRKTKA